MKISDKFVISSLAGENIILPIDCDYVDYDSVFMLNETGMFIVSCLPAEKQEIIDKLLANYNVTYDEAEKCLDEFLQQVKEYGIIE